MINFIDQNVQGKILTASLFNLKTGEEYPLGIKPDNRRGGQLSRDLFIKPIEIPVDGKILTFKFRIDFTDKRIDKIKMDPFLDLEIFDYSKKKPKMPTQKYENVHNTPKTKKDGVWLYDLSDKRVKIDGKNLPINYSFILKMTKQFTISARARIIK